jgi:predicted transcriptional regulator
MRIRRLNESNADYYIDFLEQHGTENINDIAKRILRSKNAADDTATSKLAIQSNSISLSLTEKDK